MAGLGLVGGIELELRASDRALLGWLVATNVSWVRSTEYGIEAWGRLQYQLSDV